MYVPTYILGQREDLSNRDRDDKGKERDVPTHILRQTESIRGIEKD